MVILSWISWVFPDIFKTSHGMRLIYKKTSLSNDDMKNYRSVLYLKFVSKIIEKVIANRIRSYILKETIYAIQSLSVAYSKIHSTETALLKVANYFEYGLTMLGLSAAFDTLDHSSITNLLSTWYGIDGYHS